MTIGKRTYSCILTITSLFFTLSAIGCFQGKNSAAEAQKVLKTQTGLASFYSSAFQGKKTANGERFDKTDWVAAHPSYPLGTIARVTNLENKKTIQVRIIDRGPTRKNRHEGVIIDLSKDAAKELGFIRDGRARVQVDVLEWGKYQGN
jgi:rare lipoprotein A